MQVPSATLNQLKKQYPYATPFLSCFVPLENLCHQLAEELPPPVVPVCAEQIYGKPYCAAEKENVDIYIDEHVLGAVKPICTLAGKHIKEYANDFKTLSKFLEKDIKACKHLASLVLLQKKHRIAPWAKKHEMPKDAAAVVGTYLARLAGVRMAKHAINTEEWDKNYCPTCGRLPNAGYIQSKEGHRFLHCPLCSSTWRFARTICPGCGDDKPEGRLVFNLEGGTTQQRAEGCTKCKYYLLVPDIRDLAENIPLTVLLYCLVPMDMLMQDQGYKPLENV